MNMLYDGTEVSRMWMTQASNLTLRRPYLRYTRVLAVTSSFTGLLLRVLRDPMAQRRTCEVTSKELSIRSGRRSAYEISTYTYCPQLGFIAPFPVSHERDPDVPPFEFLFSFRMPVSSAPYGSHRS
jgi:hypothetical protein